MLFYFSATQVEPTLELRVKIRKSMTAHLYALHSIAAVRPTSNNSEVGKRVMLVDDNPAIRKALHNVFEFNSDWSVCEAANGREGIEKAERMKPDLIVLDVSMPEMNGIDVAKVIHRIMPEVPLILCSLYADELLDAEAQSAGVKAVVSKSQNMQALVSKARELLRAS
jgi:CheY-like chemotaxis protein